MSEAINSSYQKRKFIVLIGTLAVLLIIGAWVITIRARALTFTDPKQNYDEFRKWVATEISDGMVKSIDSIFFVPGQGDPGADNTATSVGVNDFFKGMKHSIERNGYVITVGYAVQAVAIVLVVIYLFGNLIKELQHGEGGMEVWARCFITLSIGVFFVFNYTLVVRIIEGIGKFLLDEFIKDAPNQSASLYNWLAGDAASGSPFYVDDLVQNAQSSGGLLGQAADNIKNMAEELLYSAHVYLMYAVVAVVFLLMEIPLMGARIVLLTILIEMVVRRLFFPMAMASVCSEGLRSPGIAYIKKYLALYVRLAMCIIIAILCDALVGELTKFTALDLTSGLLRSACIFVVYTTCTKIYANTSALAGSILGVH